MEACGAQNGTVPLDNLGAVSQAGLTVESKVYNVAGAVLDDRTSGGITLASRQVLNHVLPLIVPADHRFCCPDAGQVTTTSLPLAPLASMAACASTICAKS